ADHAGHILGGDHVDAESSGGLGVLAHGLVVQAGLGLIEVDGGKDHQGVGQIDHGGLVQQQGGEEIAGGDAQRGGQGGHQLHLDQLGARAEVDPVDVGRQSRGKDVDVHAVDDLLRAQVDGGVGVDHVHQNT